MNEPWTKPSEAELKSRLTPLQFEVTQNDATEPPFRNAYWDNHEAGIYVDITTGEPLFSSIDKFDSGSGWPSFTKPIQKQVVTEHKDIAFGMVRAGLAEPAVYDGSWTEWASRPETTKEKTA